MSRCDDFPDPIPNTHNHLGATQFPQSVNEYLSTEINARATMGPFTIPPFLQCIGISPISTRPKKESGKRRIILDLSFPPGGSVNDSIEKNWYCGEEVKLKYPMIDTLASRILELKKDGKVLLWKCDLSCYFRQVPICPCDYSLIGMRWHNLLFFNRMMLMGLRSAAYVCQRITSAIVHIHRKMLYWSINYLSDFGSAEKEKEAWSSFSVMGTLLSNLGVEEAVAKAI